MTYVPATTPRAHQVEALARIAGRPLEPSSADAFALLMEMGTGKTKVVLDEFGAREAIGDLHDLLVVAPAGSYLNWCQDKSDFQPSQFRAHLSPELLMRLVVLPWVSGAGVTAKRKLRLFLEVRDRPRCLLVNVEALSSVRAAVDAAADFLRAEGRRSMMVVDESTTIRNDSNRTETVMDLGRLADCRRILTGLVSPKSPLDLYRQFEFLDPKILGYDSFVAFRSRYARVRQVCMVKQYELRRKFLRAAGLDEEGVSSHLPDEALRAKVRITYPNVEARTMNRGAMIDCLAAAADGMGRDLMIDAIGRLGGYVQSVPIIEGFQNVEELHDKMAPYSYRVVKEDCLDLPPKIYQMRKVDLTSDQRRMYDEIKKFATTEIEDGEYVTATTVITRMIRLQQVVCGYAVSEADNIKPVKSNRIKSLMELLADHSGKAIVWATYRWPIARIVEALEKEYGPGSTAQFHGGNRATRADDERRFLGDPACRFMVSTQRAGGIGNTWVNASLVVYFANSHDLELRAQSEDRSHRDGLRHPVTYVDLVAEGTVDDVIIAALRKKIDMAATINGDNWREWLI